MLATKVQLSGSEFSEFLNNQNEDMLCSNLYFVDYSPLVSDYWF